jgi:hypothetical protein
MKRLTITMAGKTSGKYSSLRKVVIEGGLKDKEPVGMGVGREMVQFDSSTILQFYKVDS